MRSCAITEWLLPEFKQRSTKGKGPDIRALAFCDAEGEVGPRAGGFALTRFLWLEQEGDFLFE